MFTKEFNEGYIEYHLESDLDNVFCGIDDLDIGEKICFIDLVFIEKDYRNKGHAKKQLRDLIVQLKKEGVLKFYLFAQVDSEDYNIPIHKEEELMPEILKGIVNFYGSLGFSQGIKIEHWSNQIDMFLSLK